MLIPRLVKSIMKLLKMKLIRAYRFVIPLSFFIPAVNLHLSMSTKLMNKTKDDVTRPTRGN